MVYKSKQERMKEYLEKMIIPELPRAFPNIEFTDFYKIRSELKLKFGVNDKQFEEHIMTLKECGMLKEIRALIKGDIE